MRNVVSFSGGRTSGYMLRRLLDQYGESYHSLFLTIFANTGKERDETLDFVNECATKWGVNIIWLEYDSVPASTISTDSFPTDRMKKNHQKRIDNNEMSDWFKVVDYKLAARRFDPVTPFDKVLIKHKFLPNAVQRFCSGYLKSKAIFRYLESLQINETRQYIGIRKDEEIRTIQIEAGNKRHQPVFPLIKWNVTKKTVNDFWNANSFDLRLKANEGNCDLCFLKGPAKLVELIRNDPKSAKWWRDWEEKNKTKLEAIDRLTGRKVDTGSYSTFGARAIETLEAMSRQFTPDLFTEAEKQSIPCSCAEKMFDNMQEDE